MIFKLIFAVIFTAGLFTTIRFIVLRSPNPTLADVRRKAVASIFFVLASATMAMYSLSKLTTDAPNCIRNTGAIILILIAAFLGLLGDVILDLKCVYENDGDFFLIFGFLSFMFGHLFYIASMICSGKLYEHISIILILMGVSVIVAILTALFEKILRVSFGKYKPIVCVYSGIIFLAVNISIYNIFLNGFSLKNITIYLGLLSILASDFILNGTYFGNGKNTKFFIVSNHALYYAGQYLIALSAYLMVR